MGSWLACPLRLYDVDPLQSQASVADERAMVELVGVVVAVVLLVGAQRLLVNMARIAWVLRDELRFTSEDVNDLNRRFELIARDVA